ncbi:protease inhibitor I42 family protein [Nitrospira sp. Nam80]
MSSLSGCEVSTSNQQQNLRRLAGRVEVPFQIHLWEDRTRGELWVPSYDPTCLVLLSDDYLRIASGNAVDSGQRTFEFKPVISGSHRILFEKRLGWKFTAEDRHVYEVTVSASLPGEAR